MSRVEWHCPDARCGWTYVEPERFLQWAGSIEASARLASEQRIAFFEIAADNHIRERHGADDPIEWARQAVRDAVKRCGMETQTDAEEADR